MKRLAKHSTVQGVVFSLLFAIVLLISLSVLLNRISFGVSSNQGFNLAEVFSGSPAIKLQSQALRRRSTVAATRWKYPTQTLLSRAKSLAISALRPLS